MEKIEVLKTRNNSFERTMKYIKRHEIGGGQCGVIYVADMYDEEDDTNVIPIQQVAIKESRNSEFSLENEYNNAMRLKQMFSNFPETVLRHFCFPIDLTNAGDIVYPFINGHTYFHERNPDVLLKVLMQIIEILLILWENGVTHNDIIDANIMIDTTNNNCPVFIDYESLNFENGENTPQDFFIADIDGYIEIFRQKMYIFDDKETKQVMRYCLQRMKNMCAIHMQKKYFRVCFAKWMMDEIKHYLEGLIEKNEFVNIY